MRFKKNNAWLFAFTDLAFLLLISLSLIPSAPEDITVHFSVMEVPSVPANPNLSPLRKTKELWELRIYYEKSDTHPTPFNLVRLSTDGGRSIVLYSKYIKRDKLVSELDSLKKRDIRPVLLPSKNSLSHDFLFAAGAIARAWDDSRSESIVKSMNSEEKYYR
jgi:hypothetical protein